MASFVKLLGAGSIAVASFVGVVFVVVILVVLVLCVVETAMLFSSASLFAVSHHVTHLRVCLLLIGFVLLVITFVATEEVVAGLFAVFSLGAASLVVDSFSVVSVWRVATLEFESSFLPFVSGLMRTVAW